MRRQWMSVSAAVLASAAMLALVHIVTGQNQPSTPAALAATAPAQKDLLAYGVGYSTGERVREGLKDDGMELDPSLIAKGFVEAISGKESSLPRDQVDDVMRLVHEEMQKRMVKRLLAENPEFRKLYDDNLRKGQEYVAAHKNDEGMAVLPNGVLRKVVKAGTGPSPKPTDTVIVNYRGMLIDGTQYDAADVQPLQMSTIMKTGSEVLQMMHVGDKWHVIVPPEKAFGPVGKPPMVGPNEALVIDVELVQIK